MKKICQNCKIEKSLLEFNKNSARKDGLQSSCRVCTTLKNREYYSKNKEMQIVQISKSRRKRINEIKEKVKELKINCSDCGNDNPIVLEFDHLPGSNKKGNVCHMINSGLSWEKIKLEINKCEVVCSNCHRIRTYNRREALVAQLVVATPS